MSLKQVSCRSTWGRRIQHTCFRSDRRRLWSCRRQENATFPREIWSYLWKSIISETNVCVLHWRSAFFQEMLHFSAFYSFKTVSCHPENMYVEFYKLKLTCNWLGLNSQLNLLTRFNLFKLNSPKNSNNRFVLHWKSAFFQEILDFPASYSFRNVSYHSKNVCVEVYDLKLTYK